MGNEKVSHIPMGLAMDVHRWLLEESADRLPRFGKTFFLTPNPKSGMAIDAIRREGCGHPGEEHCGKEADTKE